jgi:ABC-type multidrug transport system ATPase subunit
MDVSVMIELRDVTFGYDPSHSTLEVPSLAIGPGLTLILGSNGSGKSTLLRLIAGVESPRSGTVTIDTHDLWRDEAVARRQLSYVPESPELTPYTTLVNVLELVAKLREVPIASVVTALDRVGLFELGGRTVRELSMGQRRRAMLATALVGEPRIVILDEPLETLDLEMREFVRQWVAELRAKGNTVLVATHDVGAFAALADRVVIVRRGRVHSHDVDAQASIDERVDLLRRVRSEEFST